MSSRPKLLLLTEGGVYPGLQAQLEALGCELVLETTTRRAMARMKTWQPDILLTDFYKRYFHDRVSNLESLLAVASRNPSMRIIVMHDAFHAADMELLKLRHRVDATLTLPFNQTALEAALLLSVSATPGST